MAIRFTRFYVGLDIGVSRDYTALCVLRRREPEDDEGQPVLEVADVARIRGASFARIAGEVERVLRHLEGSATVGIDASGLGEGAVQEVRRRGIRTVAVKFTGGQAIVTRGDQWSVPSASLYENLYAAMSQHRLKLNPEHAMTPVLVQEMDACEVEHTPSGGTRYQVQVADGHGDALVSLGIAVTLHEERYQTLVNVRERRARTRDRQRPQGSPRRTDAARQLIMSRRRERHEDSMRALWRQEYPDDPFPG